MREHAAGPVKAAERKLRRFVTVRGFTCLVWGFGLYLCFVNSISLLSLETAAETNDELLPAEEELRQRHPRQIGRAGKAVTAQPASPSSADATAGPPPLAASPCASGDCRDAGGLCAELEKLEAEAEGVAVADGTAMVLISSVWAVPADKVGGGRSGWQLVLPALHTNLRNPSVVAIWLFSPPLECNMRRPKGRPQPRLRLVTNKLERPPSFAEMVGAALAGSAAGGRHELIVAVSRADVHWPRPISCLKTEGLRDGQSALALSCHANARDCVQPELAANSSSEPLADAAWAASYWPCRQREHNPAHCVQLLDHCYKYNRLHHALVLAPELSREALEALGRVSAVFGSESSAVGELRSVIRRWHNPCRELAPVCERCAQLPELHDLRFKSPATTMPIEPAPLPAKYVDSRAGCRAAQIAVPRSYPSPSPQSTAPMPVPSQAPLPAHVPAPQWRPPLDAASAKSSGAGGVAASASAEATNTSGAEQRQHSAQGAALDAAGGEASATGATGAASPSLPSRRSSAVRSGVMAILRHESLPLEAAERFAALAGTWGSLCEGDSDFAAAHRTSSCAAGTFDLRRYRTMPLALQAYAAFHASFALRDDAPLLVFRPNQYGMGNRLRSMKSALLVAMLTGRVFRVEWVEPYPLDTLVRPEAIDWRSRPSQHAAHRSTEVICLPFGVASEPSENCGRHLSVLQSGDLREAYRAEVLEVNVFTDLHIYLAHNRCYQRTLEELQPTCPKRLGCLFRFLFSPQPVVQRALDALFDAGGTATGGAPAAKPGAEHVAVQVRNRLWRLEASKLKGESNAPKRIVECMARWVPAGQPVFFTADDDSLYPAARTLWGERLREHKGAVFAPWSSGGKVDASSLGETEERAVIKAFVDWFAMQRASLLVYTFGSSFGKTAAEASDSPNIDVNHTRCRFDEQVGSAHALPSATYVTYDTRRVPGA